MRVLQSVRISLAATGHAPDPSAAGSLPQHLQPLPVHGWPILGRAVQLHQCMPRFSKVFSPKLNRLLRVRRKAVQLSRKGLEACCTAMLHASGKVGSLASV